MASASTTQQYNLIGRRLADSIKKVMNNQGKIIEMNYNDKSKVWNNTVTNTDLVTKICESPIKLVDDINIYARPKVQPYLIQ